MKLNRHILPCLAVLASAACSSPLFEPEETATEIAFVVPEVEEVTRAEINASTVKEVYMYGNKDKFPLFDNMKITRPAAGNIWHPDVKHYWEQNSAYTFYGYAYTQPSSTSGGSIVISNGGKTIDVVQPSSYTLGADGRSNTIDYLLSYHVAFSKSEPRQVVPVILEHAFSKVSLYVTRATSMNHIDISNLKVTFGRLNYKSKMICTIHKEYDVHNVKSNEWSFTHDPATTDYEYLLSTPQEVADKVKDNLTPAKPLMSFVALPNDKIGMADYTLSISYEVNAEGKTKTYSRSFRLADITEQSWMSGHHVQYTFLIDTGIHLVGSIKEWLNGDQIEGTIIPPIVTPEQQAE